jgi:hypothetical protein
MNWPAYSPDLNPIENVWAIFKRQYRKTVWERRRIPHNKEELIVLVQEVWEGLPWVAMLGVFPYHAYEVH